MRVRSPIVIVIVVPFGRESVFSGVGAALTALRAISTPSVVLARCRGAGATARGAEDWDGGGDRFRR